MKAILQRFIKDKVTFGKLYLPWIKHVQPAIYTLELPWKDNLHNVSCIPAGIYSLKPFKSPRHGDTWKLQDTPGRADCEFHPANFACDTVWNGQQVHNQLQGCIAPGFAMDKDIPMLLKSQAAMDYLRTTIGINTEWQLEIRE